MRLTGLAAAISIKLSSSIDDVVWLAPFLTANSSASTRLRNSVVYMSVCLVQTGVAMAIAYSGDGFVKWLAKDSENMWSSDKILTVAAACMMIVLGIKLTREYIAEWQEPDADGDKEDYQNPLYADEVSLPCSPLSAKSTDPLCPDEVSPPCSPPAAESTDPWCADKVFPPSTPLSAQSTDIEHGEEAAQVAAPASAEKKEETRTQALFVIAFIGSVDDLTLFVPMLVGKGFNMIELVLGGFIAAASIVLLCMFVGLCKPIADFLSKVPLFAIVFFFATILLVKAFMMD